MSFPNFGLDKAMNLFKSGNSKGRKEVRATREADIERMKSDTRAVFDEQLGRLAALNEQLRQALE